MRRTVIPSARRPGSAHPTRTCYGCRRTLPLDTRHFYASPLATDGGRMRACKDCSKDFTTWNRWRRRAARVGPTYFTDLLRVHRRTLALLELFAAKLATGTVPGALRAAEMPPRAAESESP